MEPNLRIVVDADWIRHLRMHGIRPAGGNYWARTRPYIGDLAAPNAFYLPRTHTIHVRASRRNDTRLLMHEYGHAKGWARHEHPQTIMGGILHAIKVGFDTRSFSSLLRFRTPNRKLVREYQNWRDICAAIQ